MRLAKRRLNLYDKVRFIGINSLVLEFGGDCQGGGLLGRVLAGFGFRMRFSRRQLVKEEGCC